MKRIEKFKSEENYKRVNNKATPEDDGESSEKDNVLDVVKGKNMCYFNATTQNVVLRNERDIELNHKRMDSVIAHFNKYATVIIDVRDPQQSNFVEYLIKYIPNFDGKKLYEIEKTSFKAFGDIQYSPFGNDYQLEKRSVILKPKLIFLINQNTRGVTEKILIALKDQKIGQYIGSKTAGSGGHVNQIFLNNKVRFQYTSNQIVSTPSAKYAPSFEACSVQPNEVVYPSSKGLATDKDEVLLKAVGMN